MDGNWRKKTVITVILLVPDGHNIPFEVYRHVIGKNAGFDLVISRCFYKETQTSHIKMWLCTLIIQ